MSNFDNNNRGVLFVNDRKEPGSKKPDRTGSLNVDGVEYFLDGWIKTSGAGAQFLSLSVKRKDKQPGRSAPPQSQQRTQAPTSDPGGWSDMDDPSAIPF